MSNSEPLVSIIVPIFNVDKYLHRCIASILHQTYKNIEVLLINDGSTDDSLNIIHQFGEKDKRIVVFDKKMKDMELPVIWELIGVQENISVS